MSLMGFLANPVAVWVFGFLAFGFLVGVVWAFFGILSMEGRESRRLLLLTLIPLAFFLLTSWGFSFSMTHRMVPVNMRGLVIDETTSQIVGEVRQPGITGKPFLLSKLALFPGALNQEMCSEYTPSVMGGYEVKLTVCYYFDASTVDWIKQFQRYNKLEFAELQKTWRNQRAPLVAKAVKEYKPQQLTEEREAVSKAIFVATNSWFASEGVTLNAVSLTNWDFTNPEVGKAFDETIVAQTKQAQAQAEFDAVKILRQKDVFEAETRVLVAQKLREALVALGISSEDAVIRWLTVQWLQGLPTPPSNLIVNTGGGAVVPAIGTEGRTAPPVVSSPTPTPTPVPKAAKK